MGQLMEERFAGLTARMDFENFAAELAKVFEPCAEVFRKLRVDFAAESLGDSRALACGGDGDL
jgi:hypothetical protein